MYRAADDTKCIHMVSTFKLHDLTTDKVQFTVVDLWNLVSLLNDNLAHLFMSQIFAVAKDKCIFVSVFRFNLSLVKLLTLSLIVIFF